MDLMSFENFSQIDSNLFLGTFESAEDSNTLKCLDIKRILTLETSAVAIKQNHINYMFIRAADNPNEDLLSHFEKCHRFISEGDLKDEKVLVHCVAGVSRSATLVISYIMVKNNMTSDEAIAFVTKKRSIVDPNEGFRRQLKLFERMDRKLNPFNEEYRQFLVQHLKYKINGYRPWINSTFKTSSNPLDNYFQKLREITDENSSHFSPENSYKCKNCRIYLFLKLNVILICDKTKDNGCDSVFVEPLQWMTEYIGKEEKGDINCHNCLSKIGSFNWLRYVFQCSGHKTSECLIFKIDSKKVDSPFVPMFSTNL